MKLLQGRIARQVSIIFLTLALVAIGIALGAGWLVLSAEQINLRAQKSTELALISSQIRSEALTLTNMVQNYMVIGGNSTERMDITIQAGKLEGLVERAIRQINEQDMDESMRLGSIRQNLIAFKNQANQALDSYDKEGALGPETKRELTILVENYQATLIRALYSFEKSEIQKATDLWNSTSVFSRQALNILILMSVILLTISLMMLHLIARRFVVPLADLYEGVREIESGNLGHTIDIRSDDEMGQLANALNHMSTQLLESQEKLKGYSAELESEVRKLSTAIVQSPNAIMITDVNGYIEYVNPQFTVLTGYEPDEVLGKKPNILKSGQTSPDVYESMWETITRGNVWRGELVNKTKSNQNYWEAAVIAPIRNSNMEITHYVSIKEDISARKEAEKTLRQLATTDTLTETLNRREFFTLAKKAFDSCKDARLPFSVLMMDADHFKNVNDRYGHQAGDEVLRGISHVIKENIRSEDFLGRYGGEEFAVALPNTNQERARQIAERIREHIQDKVFVSGEQSIPVTISIGVASWTDETAIDGLMFKADLALYRAKHSGRNRVSLYEPQP